MRVAWILLPTLLIACVEESPVVEARGTRALHASTTAPTLAAPEPSARAATEMAAPDRAMAAPDMAMARPDMAMAPATSRGSLTSRSPVAREEAVLDFEGDLAELAPLATGDGSAAVRRAAVQRLADGETPVTQAALRRALEDDDPDVLAEAILAVAALRDPKAAPALRRLRTHPDDEVRGLAEDALDAVAP